MLRHSFLLAVFAGALACGALADDESQAPPVCDGKEQSNCNRKVKDDGGSTDGSALFQSKVRVSKDSEEEDSDQAVLKAWMMNELDRRDAAAAKVALAQNERMEEALRERDEQITHLQLNILALMKGLNPKLFDEFQDHGANGLEDPMPSWEEVQELLLQKGVTATVSSDKEKVRKAQARLKDLVLHSLVQLKKTTWFDWDAIDQEIKAVVAPYIAQAKNYATQEATRLMNKAKKYAKDAANKAMKKAETFAETAVSTVKTAFNGIIEGVKTKFNGIIEGMKGWVKKIGKVLEDLGKFTKQLYDTYLKPIVNFVWECANSAKSATDFMFCMVRPVIDKVLEVYFPSESVASKLPFPADEEHLVFDGESGSMQKQVECEDCQENDPRDKSPAVCDGTSMTFVQVLTVTGSSCNIPFMSGNSGVSPLEMIRKKTIDCGMKALLWKAGGILPKISEAVEKTMKFVKYCQDTIPELSIKISAFMKKSSALYNKSLSDENVIGAYESVNNAAEDATDLKTSAKKAMQELANFEPSVDAARGLADLFVDVYAKAQACNISFKTAYQSLLTLKNSAASDPDVKVLATAAEAIMNSGLQFLHTAMSQVNYIRENGAKMEDEIVSAVTAALKDPGALLGDVGQFLAKCALARAPYMKAYLEVAVAGIPVIRISVHERDGIQAAYFNVSPTGVMTIAHYNFSWASLGEHNGQELHIGALFWQARFKLYVRKNPSNIMGIPIPSGALGNLKFLELGVVGVNYSLRALGVNGSFPIPLLSSLPPIALPLPIETEVAAEEPAPAVAEALKNAKAKIIANEDEADSITMGTHAGLKGPAGAAALDNSLDNALTTLEDTCTFDSTCTRCRDSKYLYNGTCGEGCPIGYTGHGSAATDRKCEAR